MKANEAKPADVDAYIAAFTGETRARLEKIRDTIAATAPQARPRISYRIPTFSLCGNLVHFAGYKEHIGFYPGASAVQAFARELAAYPTSKGTVQFPFDRPVPLALIREIVKFRVTENLALDVARQARRKRKAKAARKKKREARGTRGSARR
jgi:uncharacterized protein YdhG (YjbR/CyaY superfamily)